MVIPTYKKAALALEKFLRIEAAGGILLGMTALLAIILANSGMAGLYNEFLATHISIQFGEAAFSKSLLHWVNDVFMVVFFFHVGLEIKREFLEGDLADRHHAALPAVAAAGGIILPALTFVLINWQHPQNLRGWAIPSATDIAFALAILSLLSTRVPAALKVMLLAIAVLDDLGAIVIIALFYTPHLSLPALAGAVACLAALLTLNRTGVVRPAAYILVGALLWIAVLKSGVHATLAGVAAALFIPLEARGRPDIRPAGEMAHALHPWVSFLIMPLFAFANAGVPLTGLSPASLLQPLPLGIAAGLFIGKPVGICLASWLAIRLGFAHLPEGVGWKSFFGMSLLCGIGFTMSLFIGMLAFDSAALQTQVRLGVLAGSLLAAVTGYLLLRHMENKS